MHEHLRQVREVNQELGIGMIGLGFQPKWARADIHWMPKGRYKIMREYMPKRGTLALDMMTRTCTVQVNLDFADEADMVRKFKVAIALQPVATALFANSPFTEGRPNGFQSYRSHIWTDTDPDRSGDLPLVFEDGFRLRALCGLRARCADVHRLSRRPLHRRLGPVVPGFPGRPPACVAWRDPAHGRLGETT